jgi:hypothetical protein
LIRQSADGTYRDWHRLGDDLLFFAFFPSQIGEQLLGLMTAAAVQASAKHNDDLDYVRGSKLGGSPLLMMTISMF